MKLFRKYFYIGVVFIFIVGYLKAQTTNTIPYKETFESYAAGTSLTNGRGGWYASSSNVIVQTNVYFEGSNAASIPIDCFLSNRFISTGITSVWIKMQIKPVLYDGTNPPVIDTNATAMFYINSNGYFVVCTNGGWVELSKTLTGADAQKVTSNWTKVEIRMKHLSHSWDIICNSVLITNNIPFVSNVTSYSGFDIYNGGGSTSYVDSITASRWHTIKINGIPYEKVKTVHGVERDNVRSLP
jgi:hypothetical protein